MENKEEKEDKRIYTFSKEKTCHGSCNDGCIISAFTVCDKKIGKDCSKGQ
ncbi:hypothetical protein [Butyrivibrio sp. AD3002]|nr:hypothetical protein [Butyrivibrio sp. AD3002]